MDIADVKTIKNQKKHGFILIELIVVLVIIVLLLAIIIPLVTNYIDDAKENAELSEARAVKVAVQTVINENYTKDDFDKTIILIDHENYGLSPKGKKEVERLLDMDIGRVENIKVDDNNILKEFSYFTINGSKIDYKDDVFITEYIY